MHGTWERFNPKGKSPNPWTPERQELLVKLAASGLSASEIAVQLGVTRNTVIGRMRRTHVPLANASGPRKQNYTSLKRLIARLATQGCTVQDIAQELNVTEKSVKWHLGTINIRARPKPRYKFTHEDYVKAAKTRQKTRWRIPKLPKRQPMATLNLADEQIPLAQRKTLLELTVHTCRWPVGDPDKPGFFFCGGETVGGHSYCAEHYTRAHVDIAEVPEPVRTVPTRARRQLSAILAWGRHFADRRKGI